MGLSSRLRATIQKELTWTFERVIHSTDSEIVHAMIHKQTYGYNTFVANRIGEIQQNTVAKEWAWLPGKMNVADVITRGISPIEMTRDTVWQCGPEFLQEEIACWPVRFEVNQKVQVSEFHTAMKTKASETSELVASVQANQPVDTLASRIDATRFSKWRVLIGATTRVLKLYKKFRKNGERDCMQMNPRDVQAAEIFWITNEQKGLNIKQLHKLKPAIENGVVMVGGRTERWMASTWNQQKFVLLPKDFKHPFLK